MTKEEEFVVKPLLEWFKRQEPNWIVHKPQDGASSTGWDLEARRKNQDLLIEAKFIDSPFVASLAGLVAAPLARRPQHSTKRKYRSWCHSICWAIGSERETGNIYQILLDYFARNPVFWNHYCRDLHVKYIFFVKSRRVARVPFAKMLAVAHTYVDETRDARLTERRSVAAELMKRFSFR